MIESEIADEMLAALLRERGYRVEKQEEPSLAEKVDDVAAKLEEMREQSASLEEEQEWPRPPRDPEQRFAEGLRDALNQSRSPWINTSDLDEGGQDAA
jgi:broad-specificity NMP kinase